MSGTMSVVVVKCIGHLIHDQDIVIALSSNDSGQIIHTYITKQYKLPLAKGW